MGKNTWDFGLIFWLIILPETAGFRTCSGGLGGAAGKADPGAWETSPGPRKSGRDTGFSEYGCCRRTSTTICYVDSSRPADNPVAHRLSKIRTMRYGSDARALPSPGVGGPSAALIRNAEIHWLSALFSISGSAFRWIRPRSHTSPAHSLGYAWTSSTITPRRLDWRLFHNVLIYS